MTVFNKKKWLLARSDLILELKKDGQTHAEIIEYLKQNEGMPFELDKTLFSRHCKTIFEQQNLIHQNEQLKLELKNKDQRIRELQNDLESQISKFNALRAKKNDNTFANTPLNTPVSSKTSDKFDFDGIGAGKKKIAQTALNEQINGYTRLTHICYFLCFLVILFMILFITKK